MNKKTIVIGASENPERYSNMAIKKLSYYGHEVVAIGNRAGHILDIPITTELNQQNDIDTVTLYVNPKIQAGYLNYILNTKPKRVIFNPGTENPEIYGTLKAHDIEPVEACTLVLLSTNQY
ncbi:CoA-binding protein [Polluticaenibacter yanchengensis]|uniref:CoA-binding protein n=1 Tax=Polluticaenibacter yanchengensis TaxID=3014562 RepID=A0ABT4UL46_9BACT|nr:CoA-binding protein [Chitinophagaceae bacterium LY-5]